MKVTIWYVIAICSSLLGVVLAGAIADMELSTAGFLFTLAVALSFIHYTSRPQPGATMNTIDPDLPPVPQYPDTAKEQDILQNIPTPEPQDGPQGVPPPQYPHNQSALPRAYAGTEEAQETVKPQAPEPQIEQATPIQYSPATTPEPPQPKEEDYLKAIKEYIDLNKEHATIPEITTALLSQGATPEHIKKVLDTLPKKKEPKGKKK
jgi:hypothetical protein